jgi:hypothetical protein
MARLWEGVRALEGRTLQTVTGKSFDVAEISDSHVRVTVHSSGRTYPIPRRAFDQAEAFGLDTPSVRPSKLREARVSEGQPAYVAAIIHAVRRAERP